MLVKYRHNNSLIAEPIVERELNDVMQFDHVIEVDADGIVSDRNDLYAPSLFDGELDSSDWRLITHGMSGQDRYTGPIMHNSELLDGVVAREVMGTPGVYVALVSDYSPEDEAWIVSARGGMYGPYMDVETAREVLRSDFDWFTHKVEVHESDDNAEGWSVARLRA